ncbi:Ribosome biogenesis protein NOP53 [Linum perenne]
MGKKPKSSRKGKKAWRANISTEDVDDFIEKSTKDALTGGSLNDVSDESLFFVDKSKDLTVRRKIEKHREKVLHCDSVLQRNPFVKAVPSSRENKPINHKKKKQPKNKKEQNEAPVVKHDITEAHLCMSSLTVAEEGDNQTRKVVIPSTIPAVEVEPPGCSYNPSFEAHQDSLAQAVAEEMQKVYKNELGPQPVPLTVEGEAIGEEERYFLEVDKEDDEAIEETEDTAEEKSLPEIINEIAKEDEEKQNRHTRRVVAKQERLKKRPPRLGKHKFVPAPTQVLLSEEITGSLRKLKGCCTLATDRFKSLEKRGLIPPSANKRRRRSPAGNAPRYRDFSSSSVNREFEVAMEEEAERKIGWVLKLIFAGTATTIGNQFFPYMGDNLVHQSISLLQVKDPYFKRTGASRLTRFAVDDDRRMKVVELGGAQELVNMLQAAKDDRTRKAALEALAALSNSDKVVGALQEFGAVSIVESTPSSVEEADIDKYKTSILKRFKDMRKDESS